VNFASFLFLPLQSATSTPHTKVLIQGFEQVRLLLQLKKLTILRIQAFADILVHKLVEKD